MHNLVLDLDETMVYTFDNIGELYKLIETDEDFDWLSVHSYILEMCDPNEEGCNEEYKMWGLFRPYLVEFITYAIERFDNIYIWSAGKRKYVDAIVDRIFPSLDYNPPIILNFDDTEISEEGVVTKNLQKLFDNKDCDAKPHNTFVMDDIKDTFSQNPDNGILCPPFSIEDYDDPKEMADNIREKMKNDNFLQKIIKFFEECKDEKDVRNLNMGERFAVDNSGTMKIPSVPKIKRISPSHNIKR